MFIKLIKKFLFNQFRAEKSLIKVCLASTPYPDTDERNCKINKNITEDVQFIINNPCKNYNFLKCPEMHFAISLYNHSYSYCLGNI